MNGMKLLKVVLLIIICSSFFFRIITVNAQTSQAAPETTLNVTSGEQQPGQSQQGQLAVPADTENTNPADNQGNNPNSYYIGDVEKILDEGKTTLLDTEYPYQVLQVKLYTDKGNEIVQIRNDIQPGGDDSQHYAVGDKIVATKVTDENGKAQYYISDRYRFPSIILLFLIFFGLTVGISKMKGLSSIIALVFSVAVLANYVVPNIINGQDPFLTCIIGALLITPLSLYLAHGFNKRTSLSLLSTMLSIVISAVLAVVFVDIAKLFGTGSEDAFILKTGLLTNLNLKGLLLGGIIFGAVGVLDDVTTAQTAAIDEIKKANDSLGFRELLTKGISVGKEHISSLVNTLVLAYVGSSFPLLILFSLNNDIPIWIKYNSEFIVEEVVRTLVGSTTLVLAVPISTVIAAYFLGRKSKVSAKKPSAGVKNKRGLIRKSAPQLSLH